MNANQRASSDWSAERTIAYALATAASHVGNLTYLVESCATAVETTQQQLAECRRLLDEYETRAGTSPTEASS